MNALAVLLAGAASFSFGPWGGVTLDLPEGWRATLQRPEEAGGSAIRVTPPEEASLVLLMTPIPTAAGIDPGSAARDSVEKFRDRLTPEGAASQLPIHDLGPGRCDGRFVSATDESVTEPSDGDYRFIDQGAVAVGRFLTTFTILTNSGEGVDRIAARAIVCSARFSAPGPPWRTDDGSYAIPAPGKNWRLTLSLPGFDVAPLDFRTGGKVGLKLSGQNEKTGVVITAFLEEAHPGWNAVQHREDALAKMQRADGMKREDIVKSQHGDMALLEYRVPQFRGMRLDQMVMNAYLVRDGYWIDVHLSKVEFRPEDRPLFDAILDSIRIEE